MPGSRSCSSGTANGRRCPTSRPSSGCSTGGLATQRRLAVIDELPYLWTAERELPSILLKVMEEEAPSSRLKLLIAGSHVGMMERLLAEREPLHDRLRPLRVRPSTSGARRSSWATATPSSS